MPNAMSGFHKPTVVTVVIVVVVLFVAYHVMTRRSRARANAA